MIFIQYPTCTTCKKAKKFLNDNHVTYTERHIAEERPTENELSRWIAMSGKEIKKFFNTSGNVYKTEHIKDILPTWSEDEKIALLAGNGMLVKRPILVLEDRVLVGFKEDEWKEALSID